MKRSAIAVCLSIWLCGCAGERSTSSRNLGSASKDDGGADEDGEDAGESEDGEPSEDAGSTGSNDAGGAEGGGGSNMAGLDAGGNTDASAPSDGAVGDANADAQSAASSSEGWGPDGLPGDAAVEDAARVDSAAAPAEPYVFESAITYGVLPEAVATAAALPVSASELSQPSAIAYETVAGFLNLRSAHPPVAEALPGRTAVLLVQWGWLPGATPPANPSEWRDLSGYLAVGEGSIELVRAVRWNGPTEPSAPRPASGVAPQSDARLVRFASFIGAGSEGIVVRLRRNAIRPVVVTLSIAGAVRHYPFEFFLATRGSSGGWPIPYGQAATSSELSPTSRCYVKTGDLTGTLKYLTSPNTALQSFTGSVTRPDGTVEPLVLTAGSDLLGPYGALSGTFGASNAVARGYFGRYWIFSNYDREGMITGQLGEATSADTQELFMAVYDGTSVRASGSSVVKPAPCDAPGAVMRTPFVF